MDIILQPWAWYVAGPLIAFVLFLFFYFGKSFGVSTNLETMCTIAGAGKISDYFKKDWKQRDWALTFLVGLIIGGFIAINYLSATKTIQLNPKTVQELANLGFANAGNSFVPPEIFSIENMLTFKGFSLLLIAGILIGFGTRYAGGCTSGHAITGLSSLQLPSLIAVIGFFIGGLLMTWVFFPLIFGL
ncbi:YeeE/YedE family protein [Tenacibaculum finnmarkense genomovar finnmarkense]|uniref:YeeE/YedE family protein n=1 Tax=Tenacibaculum finnmarkense TaxID=2781243 RepID=UPI000C5A95F5|nr:YeeE/YedE thiosulfate transporter family protein [Tenacibaculum finnmarkense]MCG8837272.1 YeeE/YedE family protein [Tenacibaculum dicentrarchi]MBE7686757.1 YeeE/YedE family protein [Tenacibaculum finnmarkense genomovar ulcerans]MBE7691772.1 YeeE/YedE family protein [Tenacibaculum finnmarkense genomovar finnmarkense]MCD8399109.1 YeeE/YedE family protein [Tenacibaculum finnmarkense genomovar ulcerans]MCD8409213.1 YeeE/YedE family protein [Tenacibaculum finnmarkense genomovar ulcerans]